MQNTNAAPFHRSYRGMQVHAVPDSDKAYDTTGRKLPWAYDLDTSRTPNENRSEPTEKGPFGRSQRRSRSGLSRSRSKTAEPRREEDRIRAEQVAAEDAVFGSLRRKGDGREREVMGEVDGNIAANAGTAGQAVAGAGRGDGEASEVMLYGFGEDLQWAALDFYERVSGGSVLEDYDRQPPGQRYDIGRSFGRAAGRSLTKAALKKKNAFAGGEHWIKVTFDSRAAADLACARSPHIIKGYLVYAEPYLGKGPGKDEPIVSTQAGAQITDDAIPMTFSTTATNPVVEGSPNGSSTTATSATATTRQVGPAQNGSIQQPAPQRALSDPFTAPATSSTALQSQPQSGQLTQRGRGLIPGVASVELLPATAALMPKQAKAPMYAWFWPGEVIGSSVPKREDGGFDYDRASLYWRLFWFIDSWAGTDFCGMRAE